MSEALATQSPTTGHTMSFKKLLIPSMLGHTLEFYDFTLYVFLMPVLAPYFFPGTDPVVSILLGLSAFAISFLMRPIGAVFFGRIGDRKGRKVALTTSIISMAIPTGLIAFLPSYAQIGILAPLSLIVCRLIQGFCVGGELNGAAVYLMENAPRSRRGFASGLLVSSCIFGALMGSSVSSFLTQEGMPPDAWRFAFVAGALIGVVGYYIRRNLSEDALIYEALRTNQIQNPLMETLRHHLRPFIFLILASGFIGVMFYASFSFVNLYLSTFKGWPVSQTLLVTTCGMIFYALITPLSGALADRFSSKKVMTWGAFFTIAILYPAFALLHTGDLVAVVTAQILLAVASACFQGPANLFFASLFPTKIRYSAVAVGYCLGVALFGGTTPMVLTCLANSSGSYLQPLIYVTGMALIGIFVTAYARPLSRLFQDSSASTASA